jgi:glycosyltransferase involved in cell wall biosynthesis
MLPDAAHPERGRFVRDQAKALRGLDDVEVVLHEFPPGPRALVAAALDLRRRFSGGAGVDRFDVVHAHFGLTAWPAMAVPARIRALTVHGTDLSHPRTRLATLAALPRIDLLAAPSEALLPAMPRRAAARTQLLPCGVDLERFRALPRHEARERLGLDPERPYLLFPADPGRAEKRHDLAAALARSVEVELLSLGGVDPERVPLWVNAASAVLVPSDREGFGLAVLEALACDVPVLATPVGAHQQALQGVEGTLCAPFELERWQQALQPHLVDPDPRISGRDSAQRFSVAAMAAAVASAWRAALAGSGQPGG